MKIFHGDVRVAVVILHCAAVHGDFYKAHTAQSARDVIDTWHRERGFDGIGYHFVVMPDGSYCAGRPLSKVGAHTLNHNRGTLGILMVERKRVTAFAAKEEYFSPEQLETVRSLLRTYEISEVHGHNEYSAKLCPGFVVSQGDFL